MNSNIVDRIRKLLALAQSQNANEAANAASAAQRLMSKHRLSAAECEVDPDPVLHLSKQRLAVKTLAKWRWNLAWAVATPNGCVPLQSRRRADQQLNITFVGDRDQADACAFLWSFLDSEIPRLATLASQELRRSPEPPPKSWQAWHRSFRRGAVDVLEHRLKRAAAESVAHASSTALARMAADTQRAEAFAEQRLGVKFREPRLEKKPAHDLRGELAGRRAAAQIALDARAALEPGEGPS